MAYMLIVDGDAVTRAVVRNLLEDQGHEVAEAGELWPGLSIVGRRIPDLVLIDLYVEGVGRIDFLSVMFETWPSVPVLVMCSPFQPTASSIVAIAMHLGAAGSLDKPIIERQLVEAVEAVLRSCGVPEDR